MMPSEDRGIILGGLDGSNPLGFLAAVGVLRSVAVVDAARDWRMKWAMHINGWVPRLCANIRVTRRELVELLFKELRRESTPEFAFAKDLNVTREEFSRVAHEAQSSASFQDRRYADFVASFGCELFVAADGKKIQDTALRTMSGAGHQHFLGTMKELVTRTESADLHRSLFTTWEYADEKLGLRWDPGEDRRYALRWKNPSDDGTKTIRGANRLAMEALPLLPTIPTNRALETTGFSIRNRSAQLTWPIWTRPIGVDVARSLLSAAEIQRREPDRSKLRAMGVAEVYRSQRMTVGKFRNFAHAQPA